jgi:DNA-binding response OmpR family regulator
MKIVVCEDDFLILMNTAEMLRELGHEAEETADGRSALEALARGGVDILLTDVGLPDMSGIDLVREARATRPGLPVIFASGLGEVEGFDGEAGIVSVNKPYTMPALAAAIASVSGA